MTRSQLLARLRRDAQRARKHGLTEDLSMICYLARCARPWAKAISWGGVRFPIEHRAITRWVCDPETGKPLVGVV